MWVLSSGRHEDWVPFLFTRILTYIYTHLHIHSDLFLLGMVVRVIITSYCHTSLSLDPRICLLVLVAGRVMPCTGAGQCL